MKRFSPVAILIMMAAPASANDATGYSVPEIVRDMLPSLQCFDEEVRTQMVFDGASDDREGQADRAERLQSIHDSCKVDKALEDIEGEFALHNPSISKGQSKKTVQTAYGVLIGKYVRFQASYRFVEFNGVIELLRCVRPRILNHTAFSARDLPTLDEITIEAERECAGEFAQLRNTAGRMNEEELPEEFYAADIARSLVMLEGGTLLAIDGFQPDQSKRTITTVDIPARGRSADD